jgi:DNA-binding transcriptional LysR family regulator
MARETVADLIAFLAVARERNFTRAAAQLGVSQPALSRTIRALEARLGVRLLTRNTRSVAPTEAGERLVQTVRPHFDGIDAGLAALTAMRGVAHLNGRSAQKAVTPSRYRERAKSNPKRSFVASNRATRIDGLGSLLSHHLGQGSPQCVGARLCSSHALSRRIPMIGDPLAASLAPRARLAGLDNRSPSRMTARFRENLTARPVARAAKVSEGRRCATKGFSRGLRSTLI